MHRTSSNSHRFALHLASVGLVNVVGLATLATLAAVATRAHAADPPAGPHFGHTTIAAEIRNAFGERDDDVFAEPLLAGETLRVRVAATHGSELRPVVLVTGPDGLARSAALQATHGGHRVRTPRIPIDRTGVWRVTIAGAEDTQGAYTARFRIGRARPVTFRHVAVGGAAGPRVELPFPGVAGAEAQIAFRAVGKGGAASLVRVLSPTGASVAGSDVALRVLRRRWRVLRLPLGERHGDYRLVLAGDGDATGVDVRVRLHPDRPRGPLTLAAAEPFLAPADEPIEGRAGRALWLPGAHLAAAPLPEVWFGTTRGSVFAAAADGTSLGVVPPPAPQGGVVDVRVVATDGQVAARADHFAYLEPDDADIPAPPPGPAALALEPATVTLESGATQVFEVGLTDAAPAGGAFVDLATTPDLGTVPSRVRVATGAARAWFPLRVDAVGAEGTVGAVHASCGGAVVTADVTIAPPPNAEAPPEPRQADLSGWQLRQANSSRTFVVPGGTVLDPGDILIVARRCARKAFELFWGVTLSANVRFVSSRDTQTTEVPSLNGAETFTLLDAFGEVQDGPTPAMASSGGESLRRLPGQPAENPASWEIGPASDADPGAASEPPVDGNGVYISEFADAPGAGNFVYEFVEIRFD